MGQLGNQPPRKSYETSLVTFINDVQNAAAETGITFNEALKAAETKELERRNHLYRENGDFFDEQIGGFGDIFERIAICLEQLVESLEDHSG